MEVNIRQSIGFRSPDILFLINEESLISDLTWFHKSVW